MNSRKNTNDFMHDEVSGVPLYRQLADYLRDRIEQGVWKGGDELPSEHDICKANALSRTTVRLAFRELINDGIIIRKRGKGSFVAEAKLRRSLNNLTSFTDDMLDSGRIPSSRVLSCEVREAGADIGTALVIPETEKVFVLRRIRLADDRPITLETACIPYSLCEGIEREDFSTASLYSYLAERCGINPYSAIETHEVGVIPADVARLMSVDPLSPAFLLTRVSYREDGSAFEFTQTIAPGDRCRFEIGLHGPRLGITFQRGYKAHA